MTTTIRNFTTTACLAGCLLLGNVAGAEPALFFFGDSLSDAGNVFQVTGENATVPYEPIPATPYAIGGHHFSNGKTWAEGFAKAIGQINGGKASLKAPGAFGNYAFGGARARPAGSVPSSSAQVDLFLRDYGTAPGDALYVIQFGGNDIRDALQSGPVAGPAVVLEAVASLVSTIQSLYQAGAREFLVVNAPNLGKTPAAFALGAAPQAEAVSHFFNMTLESGFSPLGVPGLMQLEAAMPEIRIYRFDLFALINDLVAYPAAYGLSDPFVPCLTFGTGIQPFCRNPDERLFWDALHPTAAAHAILAQEALAAISGD